MHLDIKTVVIILSNLLLFMLTVMVNNSLAAYSLYLALPALYLIPALLHLQLGWGMVAVAVQGLLIDSNLEHTTYGFHLVLLLVLFTALTYYKSTLRRAGHYQILLLCIGINTLVIFIQSIRYGNIPLLTQGHYWLRLLLDIGLSGLVLMLITSWFVALQRQLIFLTGADLDSDDE